MVPSREVEKSDFGNFPTDMVMLVSIIKESDTKYRLTGINILNHSAESPYYTPNDPEMARIGGRKGTAPDQVGNEDFTEFYGTSIGRQPSQYKGKVVGYIIHASCWVLFNQVEGLKLKEAKLAKLVQVCRKHWRKNTMWRLYDNNLRISSRSSNIPLEVAILIAEWVCPIKHTLSDIKNTGNMLLVFGWNLPDWFWQRRLDEGLFIELDKLKKEMSPVGWQLRLNLMCLVVGRTEFRSSSGLASRERVLKSILALEKPYLTLESAKEKALIEKGKKNESQ
ncbi:hypothetical protein PROQFM164_S02g001750 [Penicillium roqueforti FM164]|uniref:Uncharacterized protein n=1 Tax=Penicillium roqueforti (strain FM164) TaxID=1365484 RepID=W6Q5I9_PENRF|nr:hypothetical protein PROQFM164_S02g001750 [Penicillium roqueforti FM164]